MLDRSSRSRRIPGVVGRYLICDEIAVGGMARVHLGRQVGPLGFCRTVAIKRLHPEYRRDRDFVAMFIDEARLAARIQHPNVVSMLDVVLAPEEMLLVMEYVHGESLARLIARSPDPAIPLGVACKIVTGALYGLHASHEARDEDGRPLGLVHRDVSPQNLLLGADGITRVADFGVAKATMRIQVTRDGALKGKVPYMAPEQLLGEAVDRRADVFAAAVVAWELFAGRRLFAFEDSGAAIHHILHGARQAPSAHRREIPGALDEVVLRGLQREPDDRFSTAREMAAAMEAAFPPASVAATTRWVESVVGEELAVRAAKLVAVEALDTSEACVDGVVEEDAGDGPGFRSVLGALLADEARAEMPTDVTFRTQTRGGASPEPAPAAASEKRSGRVRHDGLRLSWVVVLGAVVVTAATLWAARVTSSSSTRGGASSASAASVTTATASSAPRGSPAATRLPEVAGGDASSDTVKRAPAPGAVSASASSRGQQPLVALPPRRPTRKQIDSCSPPYYYEHGIKRFKRQCL